MITKHTIRVRNMLTSAFPWFWEFLDRARFGIVFLARFRRDGFFAPFPYRLKRAIIHHVMDRLKLEVLIETGTYLGDTPWYFRHILNEIHTIEVSPMLADEAKRRFRGWSNVTIYEGDSGVVLPSVVSSISRPVLFWLDGHYDHGITGKGALDCPIYKELEAIFETSATHWVILIDDARDFGRAQDYPRLESIRDFIASRVPKFSMWVENDIVWIVPESGFDSLSGRAGGLCKRL